MKHITTKLALPTTIGEALAQLLPDEVACVVNAHGTPVGITDVHVLTQACAHGFRSDSLAHCMWRVPTFRMPLHTPTQIVFKGTGGYMVDMVSSTPTQMMAWAYVHQALPPTLAPIVDQLAEIASQVGVQLYVVGGAVRSLLINEPITDLDVAVHGDMTVIASAMEQQLGTAIIQRSAFNTATLALPAEVAARTGIAYLDIVPLRTETYAHPGALPMVAPTASIVRDLARRDLTINAMAIAYHVDAPMPLYDPFAGATDLHMRQARVLHPLSVIDDPTRAIRVARFIVRLQLQADATTRRAIHWAVAAGVIARVSRQRWMHEIMHMLDEHHPDAVVRILQRWGVLRQIDRSLTHGVAPEVHQLARQWRIVAMIWRAPATQLAVCMATWVDAPKPLRGIVLLRQTMRRWKALQSASPSRVVAYMRQFDRQLLEQVAILEPLLARIVHRGITAEVAMPPMRINGNDVLCEGVPPGPMVGRLLQALRDALLDGVPSLHTQADQLAWVRRRMRKG